MDFPLRVIPAAEPSGITGVILAIDYGQKRLGLALSDEHGVASRPFATWVRANRRRDLGRLRELVRKEGVRRIVVGLPLHMDGTPSEMSEEVKAFATRVEKALGIRVELMDERLSSWEAARILSGKKSRPVRAVKNETMRSRKKPLDDVAAAVILRDYLDKTRSHPGARD
jgi:putative holliday junction resolvase